MRIAVQASVALLAALTVGAGVCQRVRRREGTTLARPGRSSQTAAAMELGATTPPVTQGDSCEGKAARLVGLRGELAVTIRRLNARGVPLAPEELLGIRQLEGRFTDLTEDLRRSLRAEPYGWPDMISVLGESPDVPSAETVIGLVRDVLRPESAPAVAALLGIPAPKGVRHLALSALGFQNSESVLLALARMAAEDPEPTLRKEALKSLAGRSAMLSSGSGLGLVEETLKRESSSDPDRETRECAQTLLVSLSSPPQASPPVPLPRQNRPFFSR